MTVNLPAVDPVRLFPFPGMRISTAMACIRKANRRDLVVFALDEGTAVAGVFTRNHFCAAPVQVCRQHLAGCAPIRALLINIGNANAGTGAGADGLERSRPSCKALAGRLGIAPKQVLPLSTGVIMETLPVDRLGAGLPAAVAALRQADGAASLEAEPVRVVVSMIAASSSAASWRTAS